MSRGLKPKGPTPHYKVRRDEYARKVKLEEGGVIKISGKFLLDHEEEVINLLKHQSQLAEQKNPQHLVSKIEKDDSGIVVEVTDHNLALHLGKALENAFKGKHTYRFLKEEK
jgi:hypothetical protein